MAKSGDSDLILEEKVAAPKFLGLTLGSPKKGYSARIWLDDSKKEVNYQEIEAQSKSVGVIPSGKGGFGLKPFDTKALGKPKTTHQRTGCEDLSDKWWRVQVGDSPIRASPTNLSLDMNHSG